jgi:hypothetical protein
VSGYFQGREKKDDAKSEAAAGLRQRGSFLRREMRVCFEVVAKAGITARANFGWYSKRAGRGRQTIEGLTGPALNEFAK